MYFSNQIREDALIKQWEDWRTLQNNRIAKDLSIKQGIYWEAFYALPPEFQVAADKKDSTVFPLELHFPRELVPPSVPVPFNGYY